MNKLIEHAKKLLALAERGIGGEKENAKIALQKYMEKHNLKMEEIKSGKVSLPPYQDKTSYQDKPEQLADLATKLFHIMREKKKGCEKTTIITFIDGSKVSENRMEYHEVIRFIQFWEQPNRLYGARLHIYFNIDESVIEIYEYLTHIRQPLSDEQKNGKVINAKGARHKPEWVDVTADNLNRMIEVWN